MKQIESLASDCGFPAMATPQPHSHLGKLDEAMRLAEQLSCRLENLHDEMAKTMNEWRSQQKIMFELCQTSRSTFAEGSLSLLQEAMDLDATQYIKSEVVEEVKRQLEENLEEEEDEDYSLHPMELELSKKVIEVTGDDSSEEQLTQPAENTQLSQERLLMPENRCKLGKRFARSQMALFSAKICDYDSVSFSPKVSAEELEREILADLEKIPDKEWESSSRQNVRPTGKRTSLQKTFGLVSSAHWRGIPMPSMDTYGYRKLIMKILQYFKLLGFDLDATTMQITKDLRSKLHRDKNNRGPSGIRGFGNYTGGETFVEDENGSETYTLNEDIEGIGKCGDVIRGQKLDVHSLQVFDGNRIPWHTGISGSTLCRGAVLIGQVL